MDGSEPRCLGRAALILAELARCGPGGKLLNRPSASLRSIFLPWTPATAAPDGHAARGNRHAAPARAERSMQPDGVHPPEVAGLEHALRAACLAAVRRSRARSGHAPHGCGAGPGHSETAA